MSRQDLGFFELFVSRLQGCSPRTIRTTIPWGWELGPCPNELHAAAQLANADPRITLARAGPSERSGERFAAVDSAFARPPPSRPVRLLGWFLFFQKSFPRPREASALGAKPRRRTSSLRCKALSSAIGADQAPPPGKALSPWRLALAVVAGAISGVVPFYGPVLVFKGGTYKEKVSRSEFTEMRTATSWSRGS